MPSFVKALELQLLARSEVERRSHHLSNALDLMSRERTPAGADISGNDPAAFEDSQLTPEKTWIEKYQQLVQFHLANGHCNVPMALNEGLARWITQQREAGSKLNSIEKSLLNQIGFDWGPTQGQPPKSRRVQRTAANANIGVASESIIAEAQVSGNQQVKTYVKTIPCMKLLPPLPPSCENDPTSDFMEVPPFQQLVNFPTARHFGKCVMCDESEAAIPKQNKGVCNNCDVAIWVVNASKMQIKWCKGCKNFRKWSDFGAKVRFSLFFRIKTLIDFRISHDILLHDHFRFLGVLIQVRALQNTAGRKVCTPERERI